VTAFYLEDQEDGMTEGNRPLDETLREALEQDREKRAAESKWLLAPAVPGSSHVHIELTRDGPVTPGLRKALEDLAIELGAVELSAQGLKSCSPYKDCHVFKYSECYAYASCQIADGCKTFNSGGTARKI
jgi:hypothetical protein